MRLTVIVALLALVLSAASLLAQDTKPSETCVLLMEQRTDLRRTTTAWQEWASTKKSVTLCDREKFLLSAEERSLVLLTRVLLNCPQSLIDQFFSDGVEAQRDRVRRAKQRVADQCK
jgi:hypothetical protein